MQFSTYLLAFVVPALLVTASPTGPTSGLSNKLRTRNCAASSTSDASLTPRDNTDAIITQANSYMQQVQDDTARAKQYYKDFQKIRACGGDQAFDACFPAFWDCAIDATPPAQCNSGESCLMGYAPKVALCYMFS